MAKLALPNDEHLPSKFSKSAAIFFVALPITEQLLLPKRDVRLGHLRLLALAMAMPEAAVYEYYFSQQRKG
jgi:hypothetical protein